MKVPDNTQADSDYVLFSRFHDAGQDWLRAADRKPAAIHTPKVSAGAGLTKEFDQLRSPDAAIQFGLDRAVYHAVWDALTLLSDEGYEIWISGGTVRDLLLGQPASEVNDLDLLGTVPPHILYKEIERVFEERQGDPRTLRNLVKRSWISRLGVMTLAGDPAKSSTIYLEYCVPKIGLGSVGDYSGHIYGTDIRTDSEYRDLTINSLLYQPFRKGIYDPTGRGLEDLGYERSARGRNLTLSQRTQQIALRVIDLPRDYPPDLPIRNTARLLKGLGKSVAWSETNKVDVEPASQWLIDSERKILDSIATLTVENTQDLLEGFAKYSAEAPLDRLTYEAQETLGKVIDALQVGDPSHHYDLSQWIGEASALSPPTQDGEEHLSDPGSPLPQGACEFSWLSVGGGRRVATAVDSERLVLLDSISDAKPAVMSSDGRVIAQRIDGKVRIAWVNRATGEVLPERFEYPDDSTGHIAVEEILSGRGVLLALASEHAVEVFAIGEDGTSHISQRSVQAARGLALVGGVSWSLSDKGDLHNGAALVLQQVDAFDIAGTRGSEVVVVRQGSRVLIRNLPGGEFLPIYAEAEDGPISLVRPGVGGEVSLVFVAGRDEPIKARSPATAARD